jgi:hypothetical protein
MKYFRDSIRAVLELDDPPDRIALAAARNLHRLHAHAGLHTISCLLLAWAFR